MDSIWELLFKILFCIFKPIFKLIGWLFASIFGAIGRAIKEAIIEKTIEIGAKTAVTAGAASVAAGAAAIDEGFGIPRSKKTQNNNAKVKKKNTAKAKKTVKTYTPQYVYREENTFSSEMNAPKMKALLGTDDDTHIDDVIKYWNSLENVGTEDFINTKIALWS